MTAYNAYINGFPEWYVDVDILMVVVCIYSLCWSVADYTRWPSGFYLWRAVRSLLGLVLVALMMWPLVVLAWIIRATIQHLLGRRSELDEVAAYEAMAEKRRLR